MKLTQSRWRTAGAISVIAAFTMSGYAVRSEVLRNSVLHIASPFSEKAASMDGADGPVLFYALFWAAFVLFLAVAVYCSLLDMRYIRARYRAEKREIFVRTIGDQTFRESLLKRHASRD